MQDKTRAYLQQVISRYLNNDARIVGVLNQLQNDSPYIVAIHMYCKRIRTRGWNWLNAQWTPSDACITANETEPGYREFLRCVRGVTTEFEGQRGMGRYTLRVAERRTLDDQIGLWNNNRNMPAQGTALLRLVERRLTRREYPDPHTEASAQAFVDWFVALNDPETTNAAPGLTDHGLVQAADFVVYTRQGVRIAGTSTSQTSIDLWEGRNVNTPLNFSAALNTAVQAFNRSEPQQRFDNQHLQRPYEPWHYGYLPVVLDQTLQACVTEAAANAEPTE